MDNTDVLQDSSTIYRQILVSLPTGFQEACNICLDSLIKYVPLALSIEIREAEQERRRLKQSKSTVECSPAPTNPETYFLLPFLQSRDFGSLLLCSLPQIFGYPNSKSYRICVSPEPVFLNQCLMA
jgi:hypothetical protein